MAGCHSYFILENCMRKYCDKPTGSRESGCRHNLCGLTRGKRTTGKSIIISFAFLPGPVMHTVSHRNPGVCASGIKETVHR